MLYDRKSDTSASLADYDRHVLSFSRAAMLGRAEYRCGVILELDGSKGCGKQSPTYASRCLFLRSHSTPASNARCRAMQSKSRTHSARLGAITIYDSNILYALAALCRSDVSSVSMPLVCLLRHFGRGIISQQKTIACVSSYNNETSTLPCSLTSTADLDYHLFR